MDQALGGGLGLGMVLFAIVLFVLAVLMPFFVYGTNQRTKETSLKLTKTNELLKEIREELRESRLAARTRASQPQQSQALKISAQR